MPCKRPDLLDYTSVAELYALFEELFLGGNETVNVVGSRCGHRVRVFDHNFFHMVKLDDPCKPRPLLMANEKAIIRSTTAGFGNYTHDKQRAIYLRSAASTLIEPDEVWEDPTLRTAGWIYIKEFDTTPYSHTILLMAQRKEQGHIVPATSYPGLPRDARKKRRGKRIYP